LGPSLRSLKNRQAGQWQLRDADGWRDDGEVKVLRGAGLAQFGLGALGSDWWTGHIKLYH